MSAMADAFNAAEYLVTRHVAAGAGGGARIVLADPEGNEFCILTRQDG